MIELAVVILLIGIMMTLAMPKLRTVNITDDLKGSTRRMIGLIKELRQDTIQDNRAYKLNFDLDSHKFWIDSPSMSDKEKILARETSSAFADDIYVEDITYSHEGKTMAGDASIMFTTKGYMKPSIIHLGSRDGRKFSLVLSPFLGRVKVFDEYLDYDDLR